jgi:ADP-ribose pyrophosphatase YjhB (NUDIX family)
MVKKQTLSQTPSIRSPLTTVDVVIFTLRDDGLQVLLVQRPAQIAGAPREPFPGQWALPGGFVDIGRDGDLAQCALRKLKEKTGVAAPYLEQLGSWGSATRDPRGWSATHVYFALLPATLPIKAGANAADARWFLVAGNTVTVPLAFDHAQILDAALQRLRNKVEYTSLPAYLLPHEFTLTELQGAYETVLGRPLEKSAFRTRVMAAQLVQAVSKVREGANRPAQLYRLKNPATPVFFPRTFSPRGKSD